MNVFFLGEDVFKATLKSPEDVAQDLWIKIFKDSVMNHYIVNKKNDIVFLNVISIDDFFSLFCLCNKIKIVRSYDYLITKSVTFFLKIIKINYKNNL